MTRRWLLYYQWITGASDLVTGICLIVAPALTMHLMHLLVEPEALIFLSYVGVFVLSTGVACLYGASVVSRGGGGAKIEVVWLLTAITRGLVAVFALGNIAVGRLEAGWATVGLFDGLLALLQGIGLKRRWLRDGRD